jgi:hypothetical protein
MTPHFFTVAGAAPELNEGFLADFPYLHRLPVSLDNLTAVEHLGHAPCFWGKARAEYS